MKTNNPQFFCPRTYPVADRMGTCGKVLTPLGTNNQTGEIYLWCPQCKIDYCYNQQTKQLSILKEDVTEQ